MAAEEDEFESETTPVTTENEEELSPVIVAVGTVIVSTGIFSLMVAVVASNESWRIPATSAGLWLLGLIGRTSETSDGRYIINLSGLIRFRIEEELNNRKLYREFKVDYSDFFDDLNSQKNESYNYDLEKLLNKIETYFKRKNYLVQFNELKKLNFDQLVNTVCMISSFSAEEKQKIIETVKIEDKLKIFEEVINFNLLDNTKSKTIQ